MEKKRIDVLLVEQGFFDSREKAKRAVMAGIVHNDHEIIDKPGTKVPVDMELFVKGTVMPYVSRGGLKLEKALKIFDISMQNRVMVDIGSSTGGFTDCALQNGAQCVYAVDVGTNQLVWKLRNDPRVIVKEKTNFRYATRDLFENGIPNIATIDVSFISLKHIFIPLKDILNENDDIVALIKPQFEAGKDEVGKKGIVKDPKTHLKVIENVIAYANECHLSLQALSFSPITGGEGNIEFLAHFKVGGVNNPIDIENVVNEAHIDTELEANMDNVLKLVVMGRACRNTANIKNRQPIGQMYVKADFEVPEFYKDIVKDELNVKNVTFTQDVRDFTSYTFKPQLKTVGPKYGKMLGGIKAALENLEGNAAMDELNATDALKLDINGQEVTLFREDLLIESAQMPGYVSENDNGITVVMDTNLSEELLEEGFVREIISKVQTMRKEAGFEVMDKIAVSYEGTEKAEKVFADNASTIADETLALEVTKAAPAGYTKEWKINGEAVTIGVEKR